MLKRRRVRNLPEIGVRDRVSPRQVPPKGTEERIRKRRAIEKRGKK